MKVPGILLTFAFTSFSTAFAQASPLGVSASLHAPAGPVIEIHGCHHTYQHDLQGWHRHGKHCEAQRGLVRTKRSKQRVAI